MKKHIIFKGIILFFIFTAPCLLFSQTADDYFQKGNSELLNKNYNAALADFSDCLGLQPDYTDAYYKRGHTYYDMGQFEKAIADLSKAIELKHDYEDACFMRGESYMALKDTN